MNQKLPILHKLFPTEARIKQKAKEKRIKEETGEKHQPQKRKKTIHPGNDDCGEDFSSLGDCSESFNIRGQLLTDEERAEVEVELDQRTELFLLAVEASFTPHHHFFGTNVPRSIYQGTQSIPTIVEALSFLVTREGKAGRKQDLSRRC